jgi:4,5-dihydroxyphthalate decarboxylase
MDRRFSLAIGDYPMVRPLRAAGALADGTGIDFPAVSPIHRAFAPMAREQRYDVAEMAIVTALQALAFGKPIVLLPVTIAARFQHRCIIRLASRPEITPASLAGKRIGVRAYTQTTGMWIRALLEEAAGLAASDSHWFTQEGAHVAEYADPPFVTRVAESAKLPALLAAGEIDAAILGNDLPDDPIFAPVFDAPEQAARAWFARTGVVPINHVLVARADVAAAQAPQLRALVAALSAAKPVVSPDLLPMGEAAMARSIAHLLETCHVQGLLPRRLDPAEVFAPARALGLA